MKLHFRQSGSRIPTLSALALTALLAASLVFSACSSPDSDNETAQESTDCPTKKIKVVVSVEQWGDITELVGGQCVDSTVIVTGEDVDPHSFEPTPGDAAKLAAAKVAVVNGIGYDSWATEALGSNNNDPIVVNAGEAVSDQMGADPHIWHSPDKVRKVADAITAGLKQASPDAGEYFDKMHAEFNTYLGDYDQAVEGARLVATGKKFAATEPVFNQMATSLGMTNETPDSFANNSDHHHEPTPAAVAAFESTLNNKAVDVLFFNPQSTSTTSKKLRQIAESNDIQVIDVTESRPESAGSFVDWQTDQLNAVYNALDK